MFNIPVAITEVLAGGNGDRTILTAEQLWRHGTQCWTAKGEWHAFSRAMWATVVQDWTEAVSAYRAEDGVLSTVVSLMALFLVVMPISEHWDDVPKNKSATFAQQFMPATEIQLARRTQENLLFSIAKYCQIFIGKFPRSVRFTVQSKCLHACGLHDFRWLLLNKYLAAFQKQTGHCDWKTEAGKQLPGRFKLTGAWCEELLSQMKHAFLFLFPKGIGAAQDSDPIAGCRDLEASDWEPEATSHGTSDIPPYLSSGYKTFLLSSW